MNISKYYLNCVIYIWYIIGMNIPKNANAFLKKHDLIIWLKAGKRPILAKFQCSVFEVLQDDYLPCSGTSPDFLTFRYYVWEWLVFWYSIKPIFLHFSYAPCTQVLLDSSYSISPTLGRAFPLCCPFSWNDFPLLLMAGFFLQVSTQRHLFRESSLTIWKVVLALFLSVPHSLLLFFFF